MKLSTIGTLITGLVLTSCKVGPNYQKPDISDITPAQWKWQPAAPKDAEPRGEWWTVFREGELNRLEKLALQTNQDLRAAMARLDQARAFVGVSSAAYSPEISFQGGAKREKTSGNPPSPVPIPIPSAQLNSFSAPLALSYEIDLWGRVRRSVESARATADATNADLLSVQLSLTGEVAATYFLLRSFDAELVALRTTMATQEKTIGLIEQRFKAGTVAEADFAKAKSEVATTKADLADVKRQREEAQATLAVLCGQPASTFSVKEHPIAGSAPKIPVGLPSKLLERRPDVASAERKVAAKNASVGAAIAGYFPAVSLTGQAGFLSKETASLFDADSKVWSIGPSVNLPVTGIFVTQARVAKVKAEREEAIAAYRQAVLGAIKDVETSLTQIRYRGEQSAAQAEAVAAAAKATELTRQRYESGSVSYLELLDAERTSLLRERLAAQVKAQSHIATVRLVKALGGAW